ncbi:hypothetical protein KSP40_PGU022260 [Platanthera guangdongensis]|uniref:Rho termination factor-like N-terminal domain-containing protein n=1 Tax=Platanthera guangdongensis TaxID=2320717 RepID=A0ABR2M1N3_9ASPA
MHAVLLPNSGRRPLSPFLSPAKSTIQGKKIADFSLHWNPRKGEIHCPNSSIARSEGSRRKPPHRRFPSNKPIKEEEEADDELKQTPKSAGNEEILALFRRIRSSISKGGEANAPRRRTRSHRTADPVSPDRNQYRERGKEIGRRNSTLEDSSGLPRRPLSKFVRKSPIPMAPPPLKVRRSPEKGDRAVKELEMEKIDEMKLPELKEVARRKGIKGLSKLKKGELLQLLKERVCMLLLD